MIRAVVFDFDGTLLASSHVKREAYCVVMADVPGAARILAKVLAEPDHGDRYAVFARLASELRREGAALPPGIDRIWARAYGDYCDRQIPSCAEVPGAARLLNELRSRAIGVYVASNTPQEALDRALAASGFAKCVDAAYGRPTTKETALGIVLARRALAPAELLMVGDQEDDRRAAQACGVRFAGVQGPANDFAVAPDLSVRHLSEVMSLVRGGGGRHDGGDAQP